MRDKKQMIIIGAVVLIIVVLAVVFLFVRKGSGEKLETQQIDGVANRMGIDYGGDFNEFEYQSEEEEVSTEETVDVDELKELDKKQQEEFEKNKPAGLTTGDEDSNNSNAVKKELSQLESAQGQAETSETVEENTAEDDDGTEGADVSVQVFSSNGYAENEVLCDAASMEEAEAVAGQIDGTVIEYQNGVALIKIKENVDDLLARLEQQGSSLELYRNYNISMQ